METKNYLVVDDLIATGGTLEAIIKLVERLGGEVVRISSNKKRWYLGKGTIFFLREEQE